jgi:oligopeptide/dipeptide ABC transporter ATP-binding protein
MIADEPTTALDVIVEAQFLDLLRNLREEFNLTILLITHNIGVVAEVADRVAVMYAGKLAEVAPVDSLFHDTKHPYSSGLLKSVPNVDVDDQVLYKMEGAPPNLISPPPGCRFHPRCPYAVDLCAAEEPGPMIVGSNGHEAACWIYSDRPDRPDRPESMIR